MICGGAGVISRAVLSRVSVGGVITVLVILGFVCLVAGGLLVFRDRRRQRKAAKAARRLRLSLTSRAE